MDGGDSVARFLAELSHQRRASAHTVAAYRRDLDKLAALAAGTELASLEPHQLRRFIMQLHGQGLAPSSLARTLSAWRTYYRWLARHGAIVRNPCDNLRPPKRPQPLPKVLAIDQAQALLEAKVDSLLELRDKAMFELFYSSGLRLSELAGLDVGNGLDFDEGTVTVVGKRHKTRTVPMGAKAMAALTEWLARRVEIANGVESALFVGQRGNRLTPRAIERRLEAWARRAGLGVHVHPHMLRHSFASHLLESSGDLRAVQEMLGHANIATTQIYTHLDFQHLAKVYDATHPRARKK